MPCETNMLVGYLSILSDKSWKWHQYQRHEVIAIVHNNTVSHTQWLTIKILYVNNIDTTQKVLHFCVNISTHSPTKHNVQTSQKE